MAEKCIELDSVEIAAAVFGNCDRNIRLLEKEFSVTAVCRGTQLRISGEPANVAAANRAMEGMLLLIENRTPLEDQTVHYCISLAHDGAEKRVKELTEDFVTVTVKGRPIRPKTLGQKEYLSAIRSNAITGYRQDLSGRCHGAESLQGQGGIPHHLDPPGGGGRGEAGLPAR